MSAGAINSLVNIFSMYSSLIPPSSVATSWMSSSSSCSLILKGMGNQMNGKMKTIEDLVNGGGQLFTAIWPYVTENGRDASIKRKHNRPYVTVKTGLTRS